MIKTCSKCKVEKDSTEFHNSNKSLDGKQHRCKDCAKTFTQEATKSWRQENQVAYHKSIVKTKTKLKYGLDLETIYRLLEEQQNQCKICLKPISFSSPDKRDKPHIDHDHSTGIVRGLLCLTCNTGLGMFSDSQELLKLATHYLEQSVVQPERTSELDLLNQE